jgi:hypothetical protein
MSWLFDLVPASIFWTILLIFHGLVSVALLGALSHQSMAIMRPTHSTPKEQNFFESFRSVQASKYAKSICIFWVISFILGGWIYAEYRINVRIPIEQQELYKTLGAFEFKEHLVVLGLAMLPIYLFSWSRHQNLLYASLRKYTTLFLTVVCWYAFLIGHIVNNVRGYAS